MTPEVIDRIDQIRHGNVPEGYKKTKTGILPVDWAICTIDECLERVERPVDVQADEVYTQIGIRSHGKGLFYKEPVTGEALGNKSVFWIEPDCFVLNIVFAWEQAIGKTTQSEVGMIGSHRFPMYRPVDGKIDIDYLISYLMTKRGKDILEAASPGGAGRNRTLGQDRFMKSKIVLPTPDEQKKIAEILTTQDKVIELKEKILAQKQRQKKYLMQQLLTGKKRLPGFSGKWETAKSVFDFKKGEQINGIELNDTFYYPMYNGGVTYSGYTRNTNCENAIIISEGGNSCGFVNYVDGKFWAGGHCYYVTRSNLPYNYLYQLLKFKEPYIMSMRVGSGLPNIQKSALECLELTYPVDFVEQTTIAHILITADREINLLRQDIEQEKLKKKALMQLLLTGIVRV